MNNNLKLILIILFTFLLTLATTMLLEINIFKHWLRQSIIVLFIGFQFYLGFVLFKSIYQPKK